MTKLRMMYLIIGLVLLSLAAGCGGGSPGGNEPKAAAQKRIINTYLEGLKDLDYNKLKQSVTYSVYSSWPTDRTKFKEMLAERQKPMGTIRNWTLETNPYVDELNNQTLVRATVTTDKYKVILKFDLRKYSNQWRIYGVDTERTIPLHKNSTPSALPPSGKADYSSKAKTK
ncbi:hypothetical protein Tfer_2154 [Thermincola ferriacetica]|uniref:DUF4878 domain-containing protein n=1 Tax=Thermincola ferriacetica TaxID=281456 RepID=A0A0L6W1E6_9FIRM|nr:hypothetical protein [Thermincola ferriacetica]KNZ69208.1 hypothetical protein Tfer_2154 [Thermincola ferriacetica]